MIQFRDREITGERLLLDSKTELYYLGHNLTLRKCNLIIKVPASALVISRTQLIDCSVDIKKELKNFRWETVILKGCRFTGKMTGNDFGRWPYADDPARGGIEHCDFTGAQLDACRFIGCDASTLKFPSWPYFTILDPVKRKQELLEMTWPGTAQITIGALLKSPPETTAATFSATVLAKESGVTEAEIRAVLDRLDGVKL